MGKYDVCIDDLVEKRKGEIIEDKKRYFTDPQYHSIIQLRIQEYYTGIKDTLRYLDAEINK